MSIALLYVIDDGLKREEERRSDDVKETGRQMILVTGICKSIAPLTTRSQGGKCNSNSELDLRGAAERVLVNMTGELTGVMGVDERRHFHNVLHPVTGSEGESRVELPAIDQSNGLVLTCPAEPTYAITVMILISQLHHVRLALRRQPAGKRENRPWGNLNQILCAKQKFWARARFAQYSTRL